MSGTSPRQNEAAPGGVWHTTIFLQGKRDIQDKESFLTIWKMAVGLWGDRSTTILSSKLVSQNVRQKLHTHPCNISCNFCADARVDIAGSVHRGYVSGKEHLSTSKYVCWTWFKHACIAVWQTKSPSLKPTCVKFEASVDLWPWKPPDLATLSRPWICFQWELLEHHPFIIYNSDTSREADWRFYKTQQENRKLEIGCLQFATRSNNWTSNAYTSRKSWDVRKKNHIRKRWNNSVHPSILSLQAHWLDRQNTKFRCETVSLNTVWILLCARASQHLPGCPVNTQAIKYTCHAERPLQQLGEIEWRAGAQQPLPAWRKRVWKFS